ncbi:hypothetical protein LIER_37339 [Lithospermum erythrorhizon]|uniref:Integrase catalytic domain-containing protein n=1 Tax=Lithospermum erythrorhizon TaxID=34254 RepID=A0AAV3PNZ6_LITER
MVSILYLIPLYQWGADIVRDLPRTAGSKRYAIVEVDYFTKWVEAKPLPRQHQEQVYQFLKEIFTKFEVPRVLVTDNMTQFIIGKIKDLCAELGIDHRTDSVSYL